MASQVEWSRGQACGARGPGMQSGGRRRGECPVDPSVLGDQSMVVLGGVLLFFG